MKNFWEKIKEAVRRQAKTPVFAAALILLFLLVPTDVGASDPRESFDSSMNVKMGGVAQSFVTVGMGGVADSNMTVDRPVIINTPTTYDFGVVYVNHIYETGIDYFTLRNNGSAVVNVSIRGTDMVSGITWTLSDTATPGIDTYGLMAGLAGTSYNATVRQTAPYVELAYHVPIGASWDWGLQFYAPTVMSDLVSKNGTVTLTATEP